MESISILDSNTQGRPEGEGREAKFALGPQLKAAPNKDKIKYMHKNHSYIVNIVLECRDCYSRDSRFQTRPPPS
jgi:hypothetical protein